MILKIILTISLCSHPDMTQVQKKMAELQKQHPEAKISLKVSTKCVSGGLDGQY